MKVAIFGLLLLAAGLISGVARILLFSAIKRKYPRQYAKIGAPSVFFRNLDPIIRLNAVRDQTGEADYKRFLKLKRLINLGEGFIFSALIAFALYDVT
jgi:hypothetical protein